MSGCRLPHGAVHRHLPDVASGKAARAVAAGPRIGLVVGIGALVVSLVSSYAHAADHGITGKKLLINGGSMKMLLISKDPGTCVTWP